ncbi:MAG: o-succinylbenzoate synthase [Acidimicrobiales bacterium]|nr:o-succinylbenzoate synthase [Acidimicrobiales bacterium]HLV90887.1 o-succinylbenzoate synthase [Acidimicrobiia bacterium]
MIDTLGSFDVRVVSLPMRHRFRGIDRRDVVLLRGSSGWGEFSPFAEYPPEVTRRWLGAALEAATGELPAPGRNVVEVNVTVPVVDPETAARIVHESGARTAKVKVGDPGQGEGDDLARLEAVADALGEGGRIRVDVNGAWDVETAARRLTAMERFDLEYAEQPVATVGEMVELRRRVSVPLAADELIRRSDDPLEVVEKGGADYIVVKVQPLGGVAAALDLARRAGVPAVVSSALETSVGMYTGLLAASLLERPMACGLNTVAMLAGDVTADPLVARDGWIEVHRPQPDPDLLDRWAAPPDVADEMIRRLHDAARAAA